MARETTLANAYNIAEDLATIGIQGQALVETDAYTIYRYEAKKQTIEIQFLHDENRALVFTTTYD